MTASVRAAPKKNDVTDSEIDPFDAESPRLAIAESSVAPPPTIPHALDEPPKEPLTGRFSGRGFGPT